MADKYPYPLLVEGLWSPEIAKIMKNKLQLYFQSHKKSNGGECLVEYEDLSTNQAVVWYTSEQIRSQVLEKECHELDLREKGKIKLHVKIKEDSDDKNESPQLNLTESELKSASKPLEQEAENIVQHEGSLHIGDQPGSSKRVATADDSLGPARKHRLSRITAETMTKEYREEFCNDEDLFSTDTASEETSTIFVTLVGGNIHDDVLKLYFENKKKSGGGTILSFDRDDEQVKITFESTKDAEEVLERKNHAFQGVTLIVTPCQGENRTKTSKLQPPSCSVVLKNLKDNMTQEMLGMLIENISNLSEEDGDFSMEMIPELNAAAVTFKDSCDVPEFVSNCSRNTWIRQQKVDVTQLEPTKSILIKDLPPNCCDEHFLALYFESPKNGGGTVTDVVMLPDKTGFLVTFVEYKELVAVLNKRHSQGGKSFTVYPYYKSLGTALYGKKRPTVKMPDPFTVPLNSYMLQFFHSENKHLTNVDSHMSRYFCELTWPQPDHANLEVKILPSNSLLKQRSVKLVETWKQDASVAFSSVISRYTVVEHSVSSPVWELIKDQVTNFVKDGISVIPDITKGKVALAGVQDVVKMLQQEFKEIIDATTEKIERQSKSIRETVAVAPAMYSILLNDGLQNNISKVFPLLKLDYDVTTKSVTLSGLEAEVYSTKSNILEGIMHMKRKPVETDPNIFVFLQQVDSEEVSCYLFTKNNINAVYEILDTGVVLIGNSDRSLVEAEKQIKKMLSFKCIVLEDEKVVRKREWRELTGNLEKLCNTAMKKFAVEVDYAGKRDQVVVAGFSDAVMEVYEQLLDFINKNTHVQKIIPVKCKAVLQFMNSKKKDRLLEIRKKDVNIEFSKLTKKATISVSGSRVEVSAAVTMLEEILSSLHSVILPIDKPGAKKFFKDKDEMLVATADRLHNCVLRLQEDGEGGGDDDEEGGETICSVKLPDGVIVAVCKDNLCRHQVDVVVNASNEDLKHIGGLAGALLKAAGPMLQKECDKFVKDNGNLKPGQAVITDSGNLPCKQVIHAVGPRWDSSDPQKCKQQLKRAVKESLKLAATYNHHSIAIPAISSGIFGFPLDSCAHTIANAVREYWEDCCGESTLRRIHLVNFDDKTVEAISGAIKKTFADHVVQSLPLKTKPKIYRKEMGNVQGRAESQRIQTKEHLTITLNKGNIQDATTDVIVNTISEDLDLSSGAVSKALLQKAGSKLQWLLREQAKSEVADTGSVLITNGADLDCKKVFHVIAPRWDHGQGKADQVLKDIVKKCLIDAETLGLQSITFPAIGTGNLGFPKRLVASLMFEQVFKFSSKKDPKYLQEVQFLLHPSDAESVQAFSDEYGKYLKGKVSIEKQPMVASSKAQQGSAFFGKISSPTLGVNEMQVGSLKLEVVTGDITKETTDAIVNSSNDSFTLKAGVSKAILDAAGQAVEVESALLGSQPHQGIIITQPGKLACQNIIHVIGRTDPSKIKVTVDQVLQECEKRQFSSVAFPALGTGQGNVNPALVADAMIDAVVDFSSQKAPQCLKRVRIVIFQPHMSTEFYNSMQKREGTNLPEPETLWNKITSLFSKVYRGNEGSAAEKVIIMENQIEPAVFQICGESRNNVENTMSWLSAMILKEHTEETIRDDWIFNFEDQEHQKLKELQKKMQITIKLENKQNGSSIQVGGLTRDVLTACTMIQEMIKRVRDEQTRKRDAELLANLVEWQYKQGNAFVPFDSLTNLKLEQGFTEKRKNLTIQVQKTTYTADFKAMTAMPDRGNPVTIKRVSKTEGDESVPAQWGDMKGEQVKSVALQPASQEYQDVEKAFKTTCGTFTIVKIERIQNPALWKNYQIKKQCFDVKNPKTNNERQLFHGTAATSIKIINCNGFNRSYAGKNAAMLGNGTYFAVDANYSANDTYSRPDRTGHKHMYYARVLTGLFCNGQGGMVVPPPKSTADPTDLYDCVTDNVVRPTMFIIFNDVQAYPEYLITFKR